MITTSRLRRTRERKLGTSIINSGTDGTNPILFDVPLHTRVPRCFPSRASVTLVTDFSPHFCELKLATGCGSLHGPRVRWGLRFGANPPDRSLKFHRGKTACSSPLQPGVG